MNHAGSGNAWNSESRRNPFPWMNWTSEERSLKEFCLGFFFAPIRYISWNPNAAVWQRKTTSCHEPQPQKVNRNKGCNLTAYIHAASWISTLERIEKPVSFKSSFLVIYRSALITTLEPRLDEMWLQFSVIQSLVHFAWSGMVVLAQILKQKMWWTQAEKKPNEQFSTVWLMRSSSNGPTKIMPLQELSNCHFLGI